jgi:hypothetical protein
LTRQASEKATTVPEVERDLSRRSTDRKTAGNSPPFRDIGVGISRISHEAPGHWRSMGIGNFCVRMMGRFTHAALSFKFISRCDVPRWRFDGCSVERTGMYDLDQSGGDDLDAASRFDGRGSSRCSVELAKRGDLCPAYDATSSRPFF